LNFGFLFVGEIDQPFFLRIANFLHGKKSLVKSTSCIKFINPLVQSTNLMVHIVWHNQFHLQNLTLGLAEKSA